MSTDLSTILQAYGALVPVSGFSWPSSSSPSAVQEYLIDHVLLNKHLQSYPPSSAYQRAFWKWAIKMLENSDEEIDERIYQHYLNLLPKSSPGPIDLPRPPATSYVTHLWKTCHHAVGCREDLNPHAPINLSEYHSTTLLESCTTIESGTTGLRTWTASLVLAEYLIVHPEIVQSRVLELGSGAGFLGMIIADLQLLSQHSSNGEENAPSDPRRESLWMTDVDEQVLSRCRDNVNLPCNQAFSHPDLNIRLLDWSDALNENRIPSLMSLLHQADADVIIGADIAYDPEIIPPLVAILQVALSIPANDHVKGRREAYIALNVRNEATFETFIKLAGTVLDVQEEAPELGKSQVFFGRTRSDANRDIELQRIKLFHIFNRSNHIGCA